MFLYNNPYISSPIPSYEEGGDTPPEETIYADHDKAYDYKLIDGVWYTRKKGETGGWNSLAENKEATDKLNSAYPEAISTANTTEDETKNEDDTVEEANKSIEENNNPVYYDGEFRSPEEANLLSGIGDTGLFDLVKAIDTTADSFKSENYYDSGNKWDYTKVDFTNTSDEDLYLDEKQFMKSPHKPGKFLIDEEQANEQEMQQILDDRHKRNPKLYSKVKDFDIDLYNQTGHLDYRKGLFNRKHEGFLGDQLENKYGDSSHIGWSMDKMGNYETAFDYLTQNPDDPTKFNQQDFDDGFGGLPLDPNNPMNYDLSDEYRNSLKHNPYIQFDPQNNPNIIENRMGDGRYSKVPQYPLTPESPDFQPHVQPDVKSDPDIDLTNPQDVIDANDKLRNEEARKRQQEAQLDQIEEQLRKSQKRQYGGMLSDWQKGGEKTYQVEVIKYPLGYQGMPPGHIESRILNVNDLPEKYKDQASYINAWITGNKKVQYNADDDYTDGVQTAILNLNESDLSTYMNTAQQTKSGESTDMPELIGGSIPTAPGGEPGEYDFVNSNCADQTCRGLGYDESDYETLGVTTPQQVFNNILQDPRLHSSTGNATTAEEVANVILNPIDSAVEAGKNVNDYLYENVTEPVGEWWDEVDLNPFWKQGGELIKAQTGWGWLDDAITTGSNIYDNTKTFVNTGVKKAATNAIAPYIGSTAASTIGVAGSAYGLLDGNFNLHNTISDANPDKDPDEIKSNVAMMYDGVYGSTHGHNPFWGNMKQTGGSSPKAQNGTEFCTNASIIDSGGKVTVSCSPNKEYDSKHNFTLGAGMSMGVNNDGNYTGSFKGTGGYEWNPTMGTSGIKTYLGANFGARATEGDNNTASVNPFSNAVASLGWVNNIGGNSHNWRNPWQLEAGLFGEKDIMGNNPTNFGAYGRVNMFNAAVKYNPSTKSWEKTIGLGFPIRQEGGSLPQFQDLGETYEDGQWNLQPVRTDGVDDRTLTQKIATGLKDMEHSVDDYLGNPSSTALKTFPGEDNTHDSKRHAYAAALTADKVGFSAANLLGLAHEFGTRNIGSEHAQDIGNNFIGSLVGSIPFTDQEDHMKMTEWLSDKGLLFGDYQDGGGLPKYQFAGSPFSVQNQQGILQGSNTGYDLFGNQREPFKFGDYSVTNPDLSLLSAPQTTPPEKTEPFYNSADRMYAYNQSINRSMDEWNAFTADMNDRMQNPSLVETQTSVLQIPSLELDPNLQREMDLNADMFDHKQMRTDPDKWVRNKKGEMRDNKRQFKKDMKDYMDDMPKYEGTKANLKAYKKSQELGFEDDFSDPDNPQFGMANYKQYLQDEEEEKIKRDLRGDQLNEDNKGKGMSFGDKLWNLKNRALDSKAGQTYGKIGAGAVRIAKPLNRMIESYREDQQKNMMMNNAYLSDNMFAAKDADITGSKGDYDANTGIFRPDDKVVVGQTYARMGGHTFNRGGEMEIDMNTYKQLIAAGAQIDIL
jgi:hypothetical protein